MKVSELKVGMFLWWKAERLVTDWSCPTIVISIGEERFKVRSLDDFKESDIILFGDIQAQIAGKELEKDRPFNKEFRPCTRTEVSQYMKNRTRHLEDQVIQAQRGLEDRRQTLATYQKHLKTFGRTTLDY